MARKTKTQMGNQGLTLEYFFNKYKGTMYQVMMTELREFLPHSDLKEISADYLHNMYNGNGDKRINGIVLVNLEKEGYLKQKHMIRSKRKECHFRPIMLYEVIHDERNIQ